MNENSRVIITAHRKHSRMQVDIDENYKFNFSAFAMTPTEKNVMKISKEMVHNIQILK